MESLKKQAARILREQKRYKAWLAAFLCLALVVTAGTVAALTMSGQALNRKEKVLTCKESGPVAHTHNDDCYNGGQLVCTLPEIAAHVHGDECYTEQKTLVCAMEESAGHQHDEGCYATNLVQGELTCTIPEGHVHGDGCYTEGEEHTLTCTIPEGHAHGDGCYAWTEEKVLTCTTAEGEGAHTHTDECYVTEMVLTCGQEELPVHVHGEGCFEEVVVEAGESEADAEADQDALTSESTEGDAEAEDGEGLEDSEAPEEEDEENQTFQKIYEDSEIRVTAVYTEDANIPEETQLTAQRISAEAEADTQEAAPAAEDEEAIADSAESSEGAAVEEAVEEVSYRLQLLADAAAVQPESAVTFTAQGMDGNGNAVGTPVVLVYNPGDAWDAMVVTLVKENAVAGELSDEMNLSQSAETENYVVTVTYSESAEIPEGAQLRVIEYAKDSEQYVQHCAELGYQPDGLLNIGFFVGDNEVEPKVPVNVKIADKAVSEADSYEIVHFTENGAEEVSNNTAQTENGMETEFSADSFSVYSIDSRQSVGYGDGVGEVDPIGDLVHEKYVEPTDVAGVYELTLNVKGSVNGNEKAKVDIVFVLDTSGSMAWNVNGGTNTSNTNLSRRALANMAITNLINDLDAEKSGIDAQYKLITFSSSANTNNSSNWQSGATLQNRLPGSASGGTNYEDALEEAGKAVAANNRRESGSKTIVIFLTDGAPTYSKTDGNGTSTTNQMVEHAQRGAEKITCDYFFAVGFGAEMTKSTTVGSSGKTAYQILEAVANATNADGNKNASATTDLTTYFESFKESLKTIKATGVSFKDELTNEVSIVDATGKEVENPGAGNWTTQIRDADGNLLSKDDPEYAAAGMEVTYSSTEGLKVEFKEDYILKTDYTYEVTTKIAPNEAAKAKYENNSYSYTEWGEPNTGTQSSNQQGIRCNVEGSANASYSYWVGDKKKSHDDVAYSHPVVQLGDRPAPPPLVEQEMTHDKYIAKAKDANGNELEDVYDLTLDLTGRVGSTTKPAYYDILFVVDMSNSMENNKDGSSGKTRLEDAKDAVSTIIDKVTANTNIIANYSVVTFDSDAQVKQIWTNNAATAKQTVKNLSVRGGQSGGTNYQAGLKKAGDQLESAPDVPANAPEGSEMTKFVVFLTDGQPTFYLGTGGRVVSNYSPYYKYSGDTVTNDGTARVGGHTSTSDKDYNGALLGAGSLRCQYFYAIGFGSSMVSDDTVYSYTTGTGWDKVTINLTARDLLQKVADEVNAPAAGKSVSTVQSVQDAIDGVTGIITEFHCYDVRVTDTLSQYVEVNSIGTGENEIPAALNIKVTNYEGTKVIAETKGNVNEVVELSLAATSKNVASTITARYDKDLKQVILDFPEGYKLESDYKYYVTVQIRPSQTAYDEADRLTENGAVKYPHTGDAKTDVPDAYQEGSNIVKISDGQQGFYTNNKATVTFTYGNDEGEDDEEEVIEKGEELYQYPVIGVNLAKLTVKKTVAGLSPEETAKLFANMKFVIDGDTSNPVTTASLVNVTEHKDKETNETTYTYELKSDVTFVTNGDSVTYTILTDREVVPGTHTVTEVWDAADVDGYERTTSYKVNDGAYSDGVTGSGDIRTSIALEANGTGTVEFKNSYKAITAAIQLSKSDGKGNTAPFEDLTFLVKEGTVQAESSMTEEALQTAINGLDDVATLTIGADGNIASITAVGKYEASNLNTSDEMKKLVLPVGEYTVVEDRSGNALENYAKVYPFEIKVLPNGNVEKNDILGYPNGENVLLAKATGTEGTYQLDVFNRQMKLDKLQIVKISGEKSETVLPGAVFNLYKVPGENEDGEVEDEEIAINLTSDSNGFLTNQDGEKALKGLEPGEYYLLETKAPDGYMLSENKISFSVAVERDEKEGNLVKVETNRQDNYVYVAVADENGVYQEYDGTDEEKTPYIIEETKNEETGETEVYLVWTLAVTNKTGAQLPVTGGPGTAMYTLGGLAVIATSLMYGLSMRRKKRKGGSN